MKDAQAYFERLIQVIPHMPFQQIDFVCAALLEAYQEGRTLFLFGNGGSASLSTHMACDLGKGTSSPENRNRVRVIALTDNIPTITAWANDSSYEDIFSEQLKNLALPGDLAIAISGSGNSPNVLKALMVGRQLGMKTVGIGGFGGGKMKSLCDLSVIVPSNNMQIVEDLHLCTAHCLFTLLREQINSPLSLKASGTLGSALPRVQSIS